MPEGEKTLLDAKYQHEIEVGGGRGAHDPVAPAPVAAAPERLSAEGLAEVSRQRLSQIERDHPYA